MFNLTNTTMKDQLQRPLQDLRISVTDRCNFRCSYCMPEEIFGPDFPFLGEHDLLSFDEMERLIQLFVSLGVRKIRITGGEPLLRKNLPDFIARVSGIDSIEDLALTTNGSLLAKHAQALKDAGLHRVTVSLDSLNQERFGKMNGRGYEVTKVLDGIQAAQDAGLPVKINMVVKKGVNDQDILPMARFFKEKEISLRFIEYMDVGNSNGWKLEHVMANKDIVEQIHKELPLESIDPSYFGEVASRYRYKGTNIEIGLISSVTQAFCSSCTRARLTAEGSFYTCLFSSSGHDLRKIMRDGCSDEELLGFIKQIWLARNDRYSEIRMGNSETDRKKIEMHRIGG